MNKKGKKYKIIFVPESVYQNLRMLKGYKYLQENKSASFAEIIAEALERSGMLQEMQKCKEAMKSAIKKMQS